MRVARRPASPWMVLFRRRAVARSPMRRSAVMMAECSVALEPRRSPRVRMKDRRAEARHVRTLGETRGRGRPPASSLALGGSYAKRGTGAGHGGKRYGRERAWPRGTGVQTPGGGPVRRDQARVWAWRIPGGWGVSDHFLDSGEFGRDFRHQYSSQPNGRATSENRTHSHPEKPHAPKGRIAERAPWERARLAAVLRVEEYVRVWRGSSLQGCSCWAVCSGL